MASSPPFTMAARCSQQLVPIFCALLLLAFSTPCGSALPVYQERALLNATEVEALLPFQTTEKPTVQRDFSPELETAGRNTKLNLTACSALERSRAWPLRHRAHPNLPPDGSRMYPSTDPTAFKRAVISETWEIVWIHLVPTPSTIARHPKSKPSNVKGLSLKSQLGLRRGAPSQAAHCMVVFGKMASLRGSWFDQTMAGRRTPLVAHPLTSSPCSQ